MIEPTGFLDTIDIKGAKYWITVSADGIELSRPDGPTHYLIEGPEGWECSCHSAHFRPGPCKHRKRLAELGYVPEWTDRELAQV